MQIIRQVLRAPKFKNQDLVSQRLRRGRGKRDGAPYIISVNMRIGHLAE